MTEKNAQNFIKKANEDPKLRRQVLDCFQKKQPQEIENLAAQCGCPCSYQEVMACFKKEGLFQEKLSDQELEKIASGKHGGGK